jgi:hypothetical protein
MLIKFAIVWAVLAAVSAIVLYFAAKNAPELEDDGTPVRPLPPPVIDDEHTLVIDRRRPAEYRHREYMSRFH